MPVYSHVHTTKCTTHVVVMGRKPSNTGHTDTGTIVQYELISTVYPTLHVSHVIIFSLMIMYFGCIVSELHVLLYHAEICQLPHIATYN